MSDWDELFQERERREVRQDRKIAQRTDRSFRKKSDQDQRKQQPLTPQEEGSLRGRILMISPQGIEVDVAGRSYLCTLRGSLRQERRETTHPIAVGDWVYLSSTEQDRGTITSIEPRTSVLSRADNLSRRKEQVIAVNIDIVLITASVISPPLKPFLLDRYIIASRKGSMEPWIVINKIDELRDLSHPEVESESHLLEELAPIYRAAGIPVFLVSATTGEGMEELAAALRGRTSVFSGQSGVGKSSLINYLTGASQATRGVVEKTQKGSHTTSSARLLHLSHGGFCIDTPGIRSFGIWELTPDEVRGYFAEIASLGTGCRFPDCSHTHEPQCAVRAAVEEGTISALRFASYCALIASCAQRHRIR